MSHIVSIETQVRDATALRAACGRLSLDGPEWQTAKLFTSEATGYCVCLPEWRFPVVCNTKTGEVHYDNFGGRWGDETELQRLLQAYAVEKTKIEARRKGNTCTEQQLADGSIKLTVTVGGAV